MRGLRVYGDPDDLILKSFDGVEVAAASSGPGLYIRERESLQILTDHCVVPAEVAFNRRRMRPTQREQYGEALNLAFAWMNAAMDNPPSDFLVG